MNLNSNFLRPEENSKNSCPGADLSWKLVRSFGPMSQFAGNNGGARTAHVAPYSHERFTPLESSLSLSPNTRIRSKSVDGGKNRRSSKQSVETTEKEREREESSSIGSSQNPPAARIRRGQRHLRRIKAGREKTVDLALVYEAKKEKYFHCRVNLFEASFFLNLTSRPWTDFVKMNSKESVEIVKCVQMYRIRVIESLYCIISRETNIYEANIYFIWL